MLKTWRRQEPDHHNIDPVRPKKFRSSRVMVNIRLFYACYEQKSIYFHRLIQWLGYQLLLGTTNKHQTLHNWSCVRHNGLTVRREIWFWTQISNFQIKNRYLRGSCTISPRWMTNSFIINQQWFSKWLGADRQQAIIWVNVDPDIWRH